MSTHVFNLPFSQTNSLPHALVFPILIKPSDPCPLEHYHSASLFFLSLTRFLFSFSLAPLSSRTNLSKLFSLPKQIRAKSPPKHQFSEPDLLLSASSEQDDPLDDERFKTSDKFSVNIFKQKAQV